MDFRKITDDERKTATLLQMQAFHFRYDPERKKPVDTCRAAFDESGRMTACLELIDYDVWFDGQPVGMGGIGGVASLPESRRTGNVRGLFHLILEEMYERGDVFSYLFPFSHVYYRKFGFEQGCRSTRITVNLDELLPFSRPGRAEQFLPGGDPEPVITVYNDFACRYNMMADRTGCQWQTRLEISPYDKLIYSYVWYDAQDKPAGYFQYKFEDKNKEPRTMNVTDMAWKSHEGLLGMLGFMGRLYGNLQKVTLLASPDFQPEIIFPEPGKLEIKGTHLGMSRVINASRAFELMKKPAGEGAAVIRVDDDTAPWNDGTWKLRWDMSGCEVSAAQQEPDLTCSAPALAQLVTGYLPFEQLALRQDVEVSGNIDTLSALFPQKKIMIADFF